MSLWLTRPYVLAISGVVLFSSGVGAGWFLHTHAGVEGYESVREASSSYRFIEPLLFVKMPEERSFPEYRPLKDALAEYAETTQQQGQVSDISIYYRNLDTSQWVGVNSDERFAPASMLKIITAMGVLREVEDRPALLNARAKLPAGELPTSEQTRYPAQNPVEPGQTYSVKSLIEHLLVESDNVANYALYSIVGDEKMLKIYDDFQMRRPDAESTEGYTAQEYSRLFRALYNGTYISREMSEEVLRLLSEASFKQGIVAGVPEGTVVSHKFGVRTVVGKGDEAQRELHDCGIVYYPERPYFLCVMTRGSDFAELEGVLKGASEVAWREVSELAR